MQNDVIKLLKRTYTTDEYGDNIPTVTSTEVFAEVRSVGMKEKYEALAIGLNPEFSFAIADYYDYINEDQVEYEGEIYRVLRTYRKSQGLEIVVTRVGE